MKYLVVNNAFNRANYAGIVGKMFDNPPAYAHCVETPGTTGHEGAD